MRTFQDLIKQGVAPSRYEQPIAKDVPEMDPFVRAYNNVWGMVSDTHMNKIDDQTYFITGSMVKNQRLFSQFIFAANWGGYTFANTAAAKVNDAWSLAGFLSSNHLKGEFTVINGDDVYLLVDTKDEKIDGRPFVCNHDGFPCGPSCIFTNESVLEEGLKGTVNEALVYLNENKHINGSRWQAAYTNEGLVFLNENNNKIIL